VPVVGRYLNVITPYSAFIVLGAIVLGIMLKVSAEDVRPAATALTAPVMDGNLMTRYLLLPVADGPGIARLALSPLQETLFEVAAALAVLTVTLRMITTEATSPRLSLFVYVFVSAMILLLLFVVGDLSIAGVRR
jgi:hypothetical protein